MCGFLTVAPSLGERIRTGTHCERILGHMFPTGQLREVAERFALGTDPLLVGDVEHGELGQVRRPGSDPDPDPAPDPDPEG